MPTTFELARKMILESVLPLGSESVALPDAAGRVLSEPFVTPWEMPQWDNSAMDGFAVRSADCKPAAELRVTGFLPAGTDAASVKVTSGTAVKIMTGAPLPAGADAVVPVEEVTMAGEQVTVNRLVPVGQHVRRRGEDMAGHEQVLDPWALLGPVEVGLLASYGQLTVPVRRRPRIAILATGDEIVSPGIAPGPGQVVNSNSMALSAAVAASGAVPVVLEIARDNVDDLRERITEGFEADALITTAGVSVGECDLVRSVLADLDVKELFWKVDIKPGRPLAFALKGERPIFSLPGNPVSCLVTFELFVRPALLKMMGHLHPIPPLVTATLTHSFEKKAGRMQFLRVTVVGDGDARTATSAGDQNTGIVKTLLNANGLALLPSERTGFQQGEIVEVMMI